jgi:putative Mn2+ efflux pump MntP
LLIPSMMMAVAQHIQNTGCGMSGSMKSFNIVGSWYLIGVVRCIGHRRNCALGFALVLPYGDP